MDAVFCWAALEHLAGSWWLISRLVLRWARGPLKNQGKDAFCRYVETLQRISKTFIIRLLPLLPTVPSVGSRQSIHGAFVPTFYILIYGDTRQTRRPRPVEHTFRAARSSCFHDGD